MLFQYSHFFLHHLITLSHEFRTSVLGQVHTTKGLQRKARKPWPTCGSVVGAGPLDVDTVGMRNGAQGSKQIPCASVAQSWLIWLCRYSQLKEGAGKRSPRLAGMSWQRCYCYKRKGRRVLGQLVADITGHFSCPLSLTPAVLLFYFPHLLQGFTSSSSPAPAWPCQPQA